ncbi:MAG: ComEA family DNA-binding protein [Phycisphaerales bacterium]|nr:ComEA family DNA-binding protein [Phycisphaerales bacterium]
MPEEHHTIPPAARWAAVLILGAAGLTGIARALLSPQPTPLPPQPAAFSAHTPPPTLQPTAQPTPQPIPSPAEARSAPTEPAPKSPPPASSPSRRININTATAAELDLLPGIGPALAQRILDHRASHGPFATLDDLDAVSGIGPKTIAKLVPYATTQ